MVRKIGIMRKVFYSMIIIGMTMGVIFPYFIQEFVVIKIDVNFKIACILAGFIVGLLNYFLIKTILKNHLVPVIYTAKEIAKGKYDLSITGKPYQNDIFYDLYDAIISMSISLKEKHLELDKQAKEDSLTHLYNRTYFNERYRCIPTTTNCRNSNTACCHQIVALLYIDLDKFKIVNDTYGHNAGDQVLVIVAERLQKCVEEQDIIVRMGGDEFTILLQHTGMKRNIEKIAEDIINIIEEPMKVLGKTIQISGSIGIALYPKDGKDIQTLLKSADLSMYCAKNSGNRYCFNNKIS